MAAARVPLIDDGTRIDVDTPQWDQNTFVGRLKHFFNVTDPRTVTCTEAELENARLLITTYRAGIEPPGTTAEHVRFAQKLYQSAYHPDTGEMMPFIGRMSFQVPGGMLITGFMMQFYRTVPQVVFWQWINQSFNALVNYTNRNAKSETTAAQIGVAYVSATTSAVGVAAYLNSLAKTAAPIVARWVPFAAVAAANCVNIPLMRQRELLNGIVVYDDDGNALGLSKKAATKSVVQVCASRIAMATPGMLLVPVLMQKLETYPFMKRIRLFHAPIQVILIGMSLTFMVPVGCAMFPQKSSLPVSGLEKELQEAVFASGRKIDRVYFNKGL